jgi:hypothetical protein
VCKGDASILIAMDSVRVARDSALASLLSAICMRLEIDSKIPDSLLVNRFSSEFSFVKFWLRANRSIF